MTGSYDARRLRSSWDLQQNYLVGDREQRFDTIVDLLRVAVPPSARILDLGCGTGSLSERILRRMPRVRIAAVDQDPVLLRLGREGFGTARGRLTWIDADLREPGWDRGLPFSRVDAVVSTTALHWLHPPRLSRLYREIARRLPPKGVFLNGDDLPIERGFPRTARWVREVRHARAAGRPKGRALGWEEWWAMVRSIPELRAEVDERDRRYPRAHGDEPTRPIPWHLGRLRAAGFREASVVWQSLTNRIVLAVR